MHEMHHSIYSRNREKEKGKKNNHKAHQIQQTYRFKKCTKDQIFRLPPIVKPGEIKQICRNLRNRSKKTNANSDLPGEIQEPLKARDSFSEISVSMQRKLSTAATKENPETTLQ